MSAEPVSAIELTRKQLYDEIWTISAAGVARKYGVPYVQLLTQVKTAGIAIPSSTYWVRLNAGKEVERTEFSGDADEVVLISKELIHQRKRRDSQFTHALSKGAHQTESKKSASEAAKDRPTPSANNESLDRIKPTVSIAQQESKEMETYQQYGVTYNVYDRETLYNEVWESPVTEVAKRYQVTDVAIHKVCKSLDIPTPPLGYWAKLRAGRPVTKAPLPESNQPSKKSGIRMGTQHKPEIEEETLAFMNEEKKAKVFSVAMQAALPDENQKMHPNIIAYRKEITEWTKQRKEYEAKWGMGRGPRTDKQSPPFLADTISEETLPRICRIIDALIKAIEPLGCTLSRDLRFSIDGEIVSFSVSESKDEIAHVLTKEENMQMLKYEEEKRRSSWATKPNIRKYDRPYNGHISFTINGVKTFRDTNSHVVEDRLGDIVIQLYEASDIVRKQREASEEADRKRQEEKRLREERQKRYEREVALTCALANEAEDYAIACKIRAYVAALEAAGELTDEGTQWVEWAKKKADWYDPTVARKDEHLGRREHGKDASDKELRRSRSPWGGWR